jgi:hypothetical protein
MRRDGAVRFSDPGDAEVQHLDEIRVGSDAYEHDVLRLQVAMDDAASVRFAERVGDRQHDAERTLKRQGAVAGGECRPQREAVQKFHHQVRLRDRLPRCRRKRAGAVHGDQIRMREAARDSTFPQKAGDEVAALGVLAVKNFHRDLTPDSGL